MKFLVDECLPHSLIRDLASYGLPDSIHPIHVGALGFRDDQIAAHAFAEDRIVITANAQDYKRIAAGMSLHPGITLLDRRPIERLATFFADADLHAQPLRARHFASFRNHGMSRCTIEPRQLMRESVDSIAIGDLGLDYAHPGEDSTQVKTCGKRGGRFNERHTPTPNVRHPDAGRGPGDDPKVRFRALNAGGDEPRSTQRPNALPLSWVPAFAGKTGWFFVTSCRAPRHGRRCNYLRD